MAGMTVLAPESRGETYSAEEERAMQDEFREFQRANQYDGDMGEAAAELDRATMGKGWYRGEHQGASNVFEAGSYEEAYGRFLQWCGIIRIEESNGPTIEFLGEDKPGERKILTDAELEKMEQSIRKLQIELARGRRERKNADDAAKARAEQERKSQQQLPMAL